MSPGAFHMKQPRPHRRTGRPLGRPPGPPRVRLTLSLPMPLGNALRVAAETRRESISDAAAFLLDGGLRLWLATRSRGRIDRTETAHVPSSIPRTDGAELAQEGA